MMTTHITEWQHHLDDIVVELARLVRVKYERGQREHGGRLWRKPQLERLTDEVLDLAVYTFTLRDQHQRAIEELRKGLNARTDQFAYAYVCDGARRALNILTKGNPDGDFEAGG